MKTRPWRQSALVVAAFGRSVAAFGRSVGRRWDRVSLLARFAVTSLVVFVVLGLALGSAMVGSIERRALDSAIREARVTTALGVQQALYPHEAAAGLSPERVRAVGSALTVSLAPIEVIEVTMWNLDGRVLFATDRSTIGRVDGADPLLRRAIGGTAAATIEDLSDAPTSALRRQGRALEAYIPLQSGNSLYSQQTGVIRTTLPFEPIAEGIAADTRRLTILLGVGLALLYGVLFRLVAGASRTLQRQAAEKEHESLHDALTGLGNRVMFQDRLHQAVAVAERDRGALAVILMDLDRFKEINDTLGHHHGDLLLQQVAARLKKTLRASDSVARLGGDEFAVLLPGVGAAEDALATAAKVRGALERPIRVRGIGLEVGASLGVALYPEHADSAESLIQKADVAMYAAKREHRGQQLYDPSSDGHSRDRLALSGELREAIEQGQLELHYQPKVELTTGRPVGAEALVRWRHPQHGLLGPDQFVPLAERGELIGPLTEKVLDLALAACADWRAAGHDLAIAVNLSARNLHSPDLPAVVSRLLERHRVPAHRLTLEITETTVASDPRRANRALRHLRARGVRLSIDDFGTGYSSLGTLRGLLVHELKIDRSFVSDLASDGDMAAIVGFMTDLGHQLGLGVVAEGVENDATTARLQGLGCQVAQGYHFARPLPRDDFQAWVAERGAGERPGVKRAVDEAAGSLGVARRGSLDEVPAA